MRETAPPARSILALPLLLLALAAHAGAQQVEVITFADAKSRLVAGVLENSTWPAEDAIDEFVIGLYGPAPRLLETLQNYMRSARVRGKPVRVVSFDTLESAAASHILILSRDFNDRLAQIRDRLAGTNTLIVTDGAQDSANIMMNFTYPSQDRVAFEISASNMIEAGLSPSRAVLMFGGDKLDLAEIYVKTEQRLAKASALVEEQQRRLAEQSATIERQHEEMAANRRELAAFESQLSGVQTLLNDSVALIGVNARQLKEKEQVLAEKEANIASYTRRIEDNQQRLQAQQQRLETQQQAIRDQERRIEEQGTVLVTQLSTIESQRFFLVATASGLLLVSLLIGLTFRAYRSKHRITVELEGKTRELEVANEKLLEVTEAKSLFLSTMSHEIRTPMNGVIGIAELLEGTDLTAQQDEYVDLILKSAETLLGLINDILDFSKIEAGHLVLEAIPFDVREVLGDTLQPLALRASEKNLELLLHIPPEVPERLIGDPLRLRQVMVNLVGNAIKFTNTGEVAVDLSVQSIDGDVRLLVEVRDTGIGIPEAQQRKIFEAFSQADSSTTRQFGGTGLGLSIAVQLVGMMGGELSVRSTSGEGSTFYFTADFPMPVGPEPPVAYREELQGRRVLIVDDNESNRRILDEQLRSWGLQVTCAANGRDALRELAQGGPFDVALLDVAMPQVGGFELVEQIRQRPGLAALRVIMLAPAGRSASDQLRRELDVSQVLLKPPKHARLRRAIAEALGVSRAETAGAASTMPSGKSGCRILLAEDNPVNRRVATEVLTRRGHTVHAAADGREAVEASARQDIDLILMDVHMPVMDGLTATRIIREQELDSGQHVPVIALTAGATVEDRENCLSAGMDGFVSKPFRAAELIRAVEELAAGKASSPTATTEPADATPRTDEPCLDWEAALRNLDGDREFLHELSEMFLTQYPAALKTIADAVDRRADADLEHSAHALKGSAQVIGARAVAAAALDLERLGRAGRAGEAGPKLTRLEERLVAMREALRAELTGS